MKNLSLYLANTFKNTGKTIFSLQLFLFFFVQAIAQDEGGGKLDVNVDVNKGNDGGGAWYTNWWVWAILVMVFIIIIVAITNRGKRSDA